MRQLDYMREVVGLFDRVPALERLAAAVYVVRGFARGDLDATSDIDLVVVVEDRDDAALLDELRTFVAQRTAWGLSHVSVPKVATAEAWRAFEQLYPAEFAYPTRTDARLLVGQPVVTGDWAPGGAILLDDIRDAMVRQLARAAFALGRLGETRHTADAIARVRRAALRFLRAALWAAGDAYIGASREVRAAAARRFGVTEELGPAELGDRLVAIHRELDPRLAAVAPVTATVAFDDWHGTWLEPRYRPRALLPAPADDGAVARLRATGYQVAVMAPALIALVIARVTPHATAVAGDDVAREATRTLAHHAFNWRNTWLEWPDPTGRIDTRRIGTRLAEVLDAVLVIETGSGVREPWQVADAFRAAFPASPLLPFIDSFAVPCLAGAGDAARWRAEFPAFARAVRP